MVIGPRPSGARPLLPRANGWALAALPGRVRGHKPAWTRGQRASRVIQSPPPVENGPDPTGGGLSITSAMALRGGGADAQHVVVERDDVVPAAAVRADQLQPAAGVGLPLPAG